MEDRTEDRGAATAGGPGRAGRARPRPRETREELVARVAAEQAALHPMPVYSERSKRRLRIYLVLIWPNSFVAAALFGAFLGWSPLEWMGFAVGLVLALAYIGYVLITERDDGRIHRSTREVLHRGADGTPPGSG